MADPPNELHSRRWLTENERRGFVVLTVITRSVSNTIMSNINKTTRDDIHEGEIYRPSELPYNDTDEYGKLMWEDQDKGLLFGCFGGKICTFKIPSVECVDVGYLHPNGDVKDYPPAHE